jgi:hypothetical protein
VSDLVPDPVAGTDADADTDSDADADADPDADADADPDADASRIFAQLSRSVTVRLKTSAPGLESTGSATKYPVRSN